MAKADIGTVELLVRLTLPAADGPLGLLAAYAMCAPPGAVVDDDDEHDDAGGAAEEDKETARLQPKLLKLHANRLRRCLGRPRLLCAVPCVCPTGYLITTCNFSLVRCADAEVPRVLG